MEQIFKLVTDSGLEPTIRMYTIMIHYYSRIGEIDKGKLRLKSQKIEDNKIISLLGILY
jgi:pentatricopeptide repeat protein